VSVKMRDSWPHALSLSVIAAACCVFMNSLAAQMREPNYQFEFTVQHVDDENNSQSGTLELRVLPPTLILATTFRSLRGYCDLTRNFMQRSGWCKEVAMS